MERTSLHSFKADLACTDEANNEKPKGYAYYEHNSKRSVDQGIS
jgi:hypothetical protein